MDEVQPKVWFERVEFTGSERPGKTTVHADIKALSQHGLFVVSVDCELEIEPQFQWKSIQREVLLRLRESLDPQFFDVSGEFFRSVN